MSVAAIIILAFAALFWVLVSVCSGGNNNVTNKVDTRRSGGIGIGWICVIVLALMVAIITSSNNNADQHHHINQQAQESDGLLWILLLIFFFLFLLYLKGAF
ncbi:unnamed protein product [Arabis nemorensis]|uniref:Uncharacterized protein n=1 Tax=Arabis nemorensis TaxID=586526 RepID=A0A565BT79_9BRAS|nr:unnamed protein product [Arabis nemorensis]